MIGQHAQLLTASFTEPDAMPFDDLFERIERQSAGNEREGRLWIAATRLVEKAGHLTREQADALVDSVASSILSEYDARDAEMSEITVRIQPLIVAHEHAWDLYRNERSRRRAARGVANDDPGDAEDDGDAPEMSAELSELFSRRSRRRDLICQDLFVALGEDELARALRDEGAAFHQRMSRGLIALLMEPDRPDRGWKVEYPSWEEEDDDDAAPSAPRATGPELHDETYAEDLEAHVNGWRRAVTGEDGWTVAVALAFAYTVSFDNEDGAGDLRIASIQRARDEGVLDENLAWMLLDRIAEAMVSTELDEDPVLREIEERIEDVEYDGGGPDDGVTAGATDGASEAWKALAAVRERRTALFKRRVLRSAGEEGMVRAMKTRAVEFARRLEMAAREWDVD